ncbi:CvpA family protein [Ramlibacter rhizophilus]|uniref:SCP domain-containing protein n=1 Tax=Ramlibacter rhizophilus TaxID=1781167 RepID=A0A4Z0BK68_9BURK|nr:CvpA family protein [Ramlibacter rhizophilus]TFY98657.1 hypothetical protein EZ242_14115 [Ramlibacter rhizophilus]
MPVPLDLNLLDLFLLLVIALGLFGGWRQGFVAGAAQLAMLVASFVAALWGWRGAARMLEGGGLPLGVWTEPLAFVLILLLVRLALGLLVGRALAVLPRRVHGHAANRVLGLVPGLAVGLVHAALLALLLLTVPWLDRVSTLARESTLAGVLVRPAEWLEAQLAPVFEDAVQNTLGRLIVKPGSDERVALPFAVAQAPARPELEARMLDLLNAERTRRGLPPLAPDPQLQAVARAHAADMFTRAYFSHVTPEGAGPFDRMRAARVRFLLAGENLAFARSLELAHQGLMDSPGHRANILRPGFGRVGIAVLDGGRYGLMVTQKFRN